MLPTTPHWILSLCQDISSHQESQKRMWSVEEACVCVSQCLVTGRSEVRVCEKKQRREVSINRPAGYGPAALPLRHPAFRHEVCHRPHLLSERKRGEKKKKREFQRRESNPGLKRERLECYRLHHIGFYLVMEVQVA